MVINTMRHRAKNHTVARAERVLTEYEQARKEAEMELKEYEQEQERIRIAAQVRNSVVRQKRQVLTLTKM